MIGLRPPLVTDLDGGLAFVLDSLIPSVTRFRDVIGCLKVVLKRPDDDVIDDAVILVLGSRATLLGWRGALRTERPPFNCG